MVDKEKQRRSGVSDMQHSADRETGLGRSAPRRPLAGYTLVCGPTHRLGVGRRFGSVRVGSHLATLLLPKRPQRAPQGGPFSVTRTCTRSVTCAAPLPVRSRGVSVKRRTLTATLAQR